MQRLPVWLGRFMILIAGTAPGCGTSEPAAQPAHRPFRGVAIDVGLVSERALLKSITAQRGEWQETRGADVSIGDAALEPKDLSRIDVVIFAGERLGDLVDAGALAALSDAVVRSTAAEPASPAESGTPASAADSFDYADVLPAFRDYVTRSGNDRFGLPLGSSALVLVYRREAFESAANREAARQASLTLEPPATWPELDALAKFFHGRDWDGDGQADAGIALALGQDAEGLGHATFLARAAALGQHRDQYSFLFDADTMEPRIAAPPFVEALASLAALKEFGPPGAAEFDAETARAAFRDGKVALLIDRAEQVAKWPNPQKSHKLGVARLPGSERVYDPSRHEWQAASPANRPSYLPHGGGWLAGVSAATSGVKRDAAVDFVKYLAGPDTTNRLCADRAFPMLATRRKQLAQGMPDPRIAPGVDSRQWSQAVTQTLAADRVVPGLRIPQADAYLADLDTARAAVLKGEPAEQALQAAAKAWSDRTRKLGQARQLWHYRRSLNTLATEPEPPPRQAK